MQKDKIIQALEFLDDIMVNCMRNGQYLYVTKSEFAEVYTLLKEMLDAENNSKEA